MGVDGDEGGDVLSWLLVGFCILIGDVGAEVFGAVGEAAVDAGVNFLAAENALGFIEHVGKFTAGVADPDDVDFIAFDLASLAGEFVELAGDFEGAVSFEAVEDAELIECGNELHDFGHGIDFGEVLIHAVEM